MAICQAIGFPAMFPLLQRAGMAPRAAARRLWSLLPMKQLVFGCAVCLGATVVSADDPAKTTTSLLGIGRLSASTPDRSGLDQTLADGTPENRMGGVSAIDHIPGTDRYLVLSDRGPKDGAVSYRCRFHEIRIALQPGIVHSGSEPIVGGPAASAEPVAASAEPVSVTLERSTLFADEIGRPFPGLASALQASSQFASRLDPEGLRRSADGHLLVSDEYGPALLEFTDEGRLVTRWPVPSELRIRSENADGKIEDQTNPTGRRSNRGMEGLALSPCGRYLTGLMQSPLLQDMRIGEDGKRSGLHARLVQIDRETGETRQFVFRQEKASYKLHEILALDANRFLVIEQDGEGGTEAAFKKIQCIDLSAATPLPSGSVLDSEHLPAGFQPVRKETCIDLLDPRHGLVGPGMPEKIEGLSWGPLLPDGRRVLVVATDNDFRDDQDSLFFVFAVAID